MNVSHEIPSWIKNNAGWWSQDKISDDDFISGIEFMIKNNIIDNIDTTKSAQISNEIPSWIKNNAGWWSQDKISDDDFISGIEFMIKTGIINI